MDLPALFSADGLGICEVVHCACALTPFEPTEGRQRGVPYQDVNSSHTHCAIVQFAALPVARTVSPTRNTLWRDKTKTTTQILTSLISAAALSCSVVFAQDTLRTTMENGKHRVEFSLHGNTSCVMVDDKIFCAANVNRAPIKLASTVSN
jgi:hypothetical protein